MATHVRSLARIPALLLAAVVVLAGCGVSLPGTSTTPAKPGVAATPTAFIDTAVGTKVAAAMVKMLNTDPLVTHIEQVTSVTQVANGTTFKMLATMSADFSGADIGVDLEATAPNDKIELRFRTVGKNAYVYAEGAWHKGKRSSVKKQLAGFVAAVRVIKDANDLRYLGEERVGKKDLHHFTAMRPIAFDSGIAGGLWVDGKYETYEMWVDTDGSPVRVEATWISTDPKVGDVTGQTTMDFTKFGGPIKVKAPKIK